MRRTKDQAEATRCALLDAAETVFFARGVANATLEQIAREAGVTRGALYWHFKDKGALYAAMLERVRFPIESIADGSQTAKQDPLTTLERHVCSIMTFVGENPSIRRVYAIVLLRREHLSSDAGLDEIEREMRLGSRHNLQIYFERAHAQGLLIDGMTPALAAIGLQSHAVGVLHIGMLETEGFCFAHHGVHLMQTYIRSLRKAPSAPTTEETETRKPPKGLSSKAMASP